MNSISKCILLILILLNVLGHITQGQDLSTSNDQLNLSDTTRSIGNVIDIELSDSEYNEMQKINGEKIKIKPKLLVINGDTLVPEKIETRGQTTLQFKRKSLSVNLSTNASLKNDSSNEKLKEFDLLNLAMDKYYVRNRLAFKMMEKIDLFELFNTYSELRLNGNSNGIFMIVEKPDEWAMHKKNSPLIIRRGYNHEIDKFKIDKKQNKKTINLYFDSFTKIYKSINKYNGEELYNKLSEVMDVENYFKWLAFNYFVRNGDYSDEVFFYIDPEINKFRIIPWDYDDIFSIIPHEGKEAKKKQVGNKLIFSSEDILDVKIVSDPFLYNKYLGTLKKLIQDIDPKVLKQIVEETYAELYPFYSREEIISMAKYDVYKDPNLENLKTEMVSVYYGLLGTRKIILDNL